VVKFANSAFGVWMEKSFIEISRFILSGLACLFTMSALTVMFGAIGTVIGVVAVAVLGWLYQSFSQGEEFGVRWFTVFVMAFMAMPSIAIMVGGGLLTTLLVTTGFIYALDALVSADRLLNSRVYQYLVA
jgi:hypothetical protein